MNKLKLYDILGKTAVATALVASILSLIAYCISRDIIYIYYTVAWILISILDYITWRSRPGEGELEDKCSLLRETAELVAILHYLSSHRDEYGVAWRIDSLLSKVETLRVNMASTCIGECLEEFDNFLRDPGNEDLASKTLHLLHECMISNGCESNISLREE